MTISQKEILQRTISALETSLKRFPGNDKITLQLALAYAQAGFFHENALEVYNRAAELNPGESRIQKAISIGYLVTASRDLVRDIDDLDRLDKESLNRSLERLRELSGMYPDSPEIHRALGDLLLIQGEDRLAIQHYRTAMALGISELQPLILHFQMVKKVRQIKPYACVFFAELYERLGMVDEADEVFQELMKGHVNSAILDGYQAFLERRVAHNPNDDDLVSESLRRLVRLALLKGSSPHEAITLARQLNPDQLAEDVRLTKDLARILIRMEDFRTAFDYLSHLTMDEETKSLLNEITVLLEKRGELDTALYLLQYINEHDMILKVEKGQDRIGPDGTVSKQQEWEIEVQTELHLAELHWRNRHWQEALNSFLRVLDLGYEDYRSIMEPINRLLERLNDVPIEQLTMMTNYFAEKREWRYCLTYAKRVLAINPNHSGISHRLQQACEKLLIQDPNDCEVRLTYGDELLRLGNIERAMREFRKAAEVPEFLFKAKRRLAFAMFKAGDRIGAFDIYKSFPVIDQEDIERLYDLMISFSKNEEFKEAFDVSRKILEYEPDFRDVKAKSAIFEEKLQVSNQGFFIDNKVRELIGDHAIGRYKYVDKIGSGGMGVVHKVVDLKTNQEVAMKILREGLSSSGRAIDRFFREARIAATLHHKNIVNIFDYNISNNYGQSYIAMEYVDGPSLREVIDQKFSSNFEIDNDDILQALDWLSQLCDALDATHMKGIIHRDIKPDNIMINSQNVVKITDFGIVHIEEATFTPTGALIGTPRYMSPEQVHGGRIDSRSDIYAVGIILYELLVGSPPFISGDISYQQVNVLPTPPIEICTTIPESVNEIIMKCLEKNPTDRFQSALETKKKVDEVFIRLGGDPTRHRPFDSEPSISKQEAESFAPEVTRQPPQREMPGQFADFVNPDETLDHDSPEPAGQPARKFESKEFLSSFDESFFYDQKFDDVTSRKPVDDTDFDH